MNYLISLLNETKNQTEIEIEICPICREGIDIENKNETILTKCNHYFHNKCLLPWILMNHTNCPMCRQNMVVGLTESDIDSNYSDDRLDWVELNHNTREQTAIYHHITRMCNARLQTRFINI